MSVETALELSAPESSKIDLLGMDHDALVTFFESIGEKPFRAKQVMKWIHQMGVSDFDLMTNISKSLREKLKQNAWIRSPKIIAEQISDDGTIKWLIEVDQQNSIETVFIPEADRGTLCISSQVGCALDCSFCATAQQGFNRNLENWEIIAQMWVVNKALGANPKAERKISNVVFMGMGEPLLNVTHVFPVAKLLMDDNAYGLSKRRVTISTAGVVPAIDKLKAEVDVSLAISLHAPNNALRDELVPVNKKYPLEVLMPALRRYVADGHAKKHITVEYVMLDQVNDEIEHAHQLVGLLGDLVCKVNLIPFNPFPNTPYLRSSNNRVHRFQRVLHEAGINCTIRKTRGDDIDAACGQLAGKVKDRTKRTLHRINFDGISQSQHHLET
ncbi:bifunctional tRNA (adenosine(37)-C2)-methyltransferase TrmG/ribosomal RNA large subunit methyltransferase RlmN [Thiomicrospira cyclica]|uniref:Dual-specificity RNA methyltransferase RlmN n=1 Tax=Thiomicrospira cyclica (strain DSM 14477 / JCM 11371 / ALM1) TaxID=717773 RepID=F6D9X4_THICA|nr:bifunctional tRNA (adenosine(37)-C2)-methyltransferase TrmG/ribosomal RNA large subunit methyltransferase RlmN [Thiomicrospira cyclica]AEG31011.1 Ribosomal RNA large subunit methyltransferase N [Thiomicrospira cyclica ALM1]